MVIVPPLNTTSAVAPRLSGRACMAARASRQSDIPTWRSPLLGRRWPIRECQRCRAWLTSACGLRIGFELDAYQAHPVGAVVDRVADFGMLELRQHPVSAVRTRAPPRESTRRIGPLPYEHSAPGRAGRSPPQGPGVRTPAQPCAVLDWIMPAAQPARVLSRVVGCLAVPLRWRARSRS
jgi:hypothetical protein